MLNIFSLENEPLTYLEDGFLAFEYNGVSFGVKNQLVKKLSRSVRVIPLPGAPREVYGYANIEDEQHLVLDLTANIITTPETEVANKDIIVLFPLEGKPVGVLFDELSGVFPSEPSPRLAKEEGACYDQSGLSNETQCDCGLVSDILEKDGKNLYLINPFLLFGLQAHDTEISH